MIPKELKIAIVTSSKKSYASLFLKQRSAINAEIIVVLNQAKPRKKGKIINKIIKIGLFGAVTGLLFRNAYQFEFDDIEQFCISHHIPILYSNDFKLAPEDEECLRLFDVGISMGNGYIPASFFTLFEHGMINVHHEILPDYAGAQSIVWPLIEGRKETGFSIHQINKGLDKGALLMVRKRAIEFGPSLAKTVAENYYRSLELSVEGLLELLETHPREWSFQPNLSQRSYTTPTFVQWIRAFANHRKFRKSAV